MLPLLLAACAPPCTAFADMTYTAPDAAAADALAAITADFAAWSGRDSVCVPGVEVVDVIEDAADMAGRYDGLGAPILLAEAGDYRVALFHELCHALDEAEGLSDADPDPGETDGAHDIDTDAYDTPALRRKEAFARVCQDGPTAVSFEAALAATCGVEIDPARARVREVVYPFAPPDPEVSIGPAPAASPLHDLDEGVIVAAAGRADGAWLRLAAGRARVVAWWPAAGAAHGPEGAPGGGPGGLPGGVPGGFAPRDEDRPIGPNAWASPADPAVGPAGDALWTWYAPGVSGAAVGGADAWTLTTDCTAGMAAGAPAWVGGAPMVFAGQVERVRYAW